MPSFRLLPALMVVLSAPGCALLAQEPDDEYRRWAMEQNLPEWARERLQADAPDLQMAFTTNPFFHTGDFDGDAVEDVALLVRITDADAVGLAIVHGGDPSIHRLGTAAGGAGDPADLTAFWIWRVDSDLSHQDRLHVAKPESSSASVSWNGESYVWDWVGD